MKPVLDCEQMSLNVIHVGYIIYEQLVWHAIQIKWVQGGTVWFYSNQVFSSQPSLIPTACPNDLKIINDSQEKRCPVTSANRSWKLVGARIEVFRDRKVKLLDLVVFLGIRVWFRHIWLNHSHVRTCAAKVGPGQRRKSSSCSKG